VSETRQHRGYIASWTGIFVSLAFVLLLLRRYNLSDTIHALSAMNYLYLLPAGILILTNFIARAQRWRVLFTASENPPLLSSFMALMVGYLANNVLPARGGDIVRSYVLARRESLTGSAIFATVVIERITDLVILLLMASVLLLFAPLPPWALRAECILAPVAVCSLAFLLVLRVSGKRCMEVLLSFVRFLPDFVIHKIRSFGAEFVGAVGVLGRRNVLLFVQLTIPIWCSEVLILLVLSRAFNVSLSLLQALFVILAVGIGTSIPSSPGFIGTYEFFFASSLAAAGLNRGTALSFAIVAHTVTFFSTNSIGLACLVFNGMSLADLVRGRGRRNFILSQLKKPIAQRQADCLTLEERYE